MKQQITFFFRKTIFLFVRLIHLIRKMMFSIRDTDILGLKEKKKPSAPGNRSRTYDLPISTSDALPLSYRRVVVARP